MTPQEHKLVKSELSEIDFLLSQIPEDLVIDRISLEARKEDLLTELKTSPIQEKVRALLTFQGKPVIGNYGIFAEFGARAVEKFSSAVTAFAASLTRSLGSRGILPKKEDYQLLIVGHALGSFGFELEEYQPQEDLLFKEKSAVGQALEQIHTVMQAIRSDDDLADAISETDNRAVDALREFFQALVSNEATCALDFQDKIVRLNNINEIQRSVVVLSKEGIQEEKTILGVFQGVLPGRRTFEFKIDQTEEVIVGKIHHSEIPDAGEINSILNSPVEIRCLVTRIGEGKPRYALVEYRSIDGKE